MRLLLDVAVTSPLEGANTGTLEIPSREDALVACRQAGKMFASKVRKYEGRGMPAGFSFLPIIFESTGRLHPDSLIFLRTVAAKASDLQRIGHDTLFNHFLKRLSVGLQRFVGFALCSRLCSLCSHTSVHDPTFATNSILDA